MSTLCLPPASKYNAQPTYVDGHRFASKAEAKRYGELWILQKAGKIECLTVQPRYALTVNGVKIGVYIGDFAYREQGKLTVEDVKGVSLPAYKLKKKLMLALYGIEVQEIRYRKSGGV